jgi:6-phosphogluconolactonase (cycloisomerase 2 family)
VAILVSLPSASARAQCHRFGAVLFDGVGGVDGLASAASAATSPDGRHVYVASSIDSAVAVFERDASTGALAFAQALFDGAGGVDGLGGAAAVTVSPDGSHIYVAAGAEDAVSVFARNAATGDLSFVEVESDGAGGVDGLDAIAGLTVSRDGRHLYAAGATDDSLVVFARNAASGQLSFVQVQRDGVGGVDGLDSARNVVVSPDGKFVYAVGAFDNAIAMFSRNATTGALAFLGTIDNVAWLNTPAALAVSADGRHVYTGSFGDQLAAFARDPATGLLSFVELEQDGIGGVDGLDSVVSIAVSPDGVYVYAAGIADDAIAIFERDASDGTITFVQVQRDGVGGVDGLDAIGSVTVSPDSNHIYATGGGDDALAAFARPPLRFVETEVGGAGSVNGLGGANAVAMSSDGRHVYTTGGDDHAVAAFARDASTLTFVEAEFDGLGGADGLAGATSVATSPNGAHVYVTGSDEDALAVFARDAVAGTLAFVEVQRDGVGGVSALAGASAVAVSPDGRHVYAAAGAEAALAAFARNATSGTLALVDEERNAVAGVDGLAGARAIAVSPDGAHLYVAGLTDDAVTVLARSEATGALSFVEAERDGAAGVDGLDGADSVAVSSDGRHVYASAFTDDAVAVFLRDSVTGALDFVQVQRDGLGGVDGIDGARAT